MSAAAPVTVSLDGNLDVAVAETVHDRLREALASAGGLVIDAENAATVDVVFLQMLVAAQRTAERAGKSVSLSQPPSGALAAALAKCGFPAPAGATALSDILFS